MTTQTQAQQAADRISRAVGRTVTFDRSEGTVSAAGYTKTASEWQSIVDSGSYMGQNLSGVASDARTLLGYLTGGGASVSTSGNQIEMDGVLYNLVPNPDPTQPPLLEVAASENPLPDFRPISELTRGLSDGQSVLLKFTQQGDQLVADGYATL